MPKHKLKRPARVPVEAASPEPRPTGLRRCAFPVLSLAIFLPAIFLVPYYVTTPGPNNSQSWEFGFNNTVAGELIALLLITWFGWRLFFGSPDFRREPISKVLVGEHTPGSSRSLWITAGIFQLFTGAILIKWNEILPYTHYGEFTYFMQRLERMVAIGGIPHRDFDFDYGSGMLMVPFFFYKLFGGHYSIEGTYLVALLLHFAIGYALLAYIISQVNPRGGRTLIFVLLAIPWINLSMGLQYTPLRFTIATASIFAIRHLHLGLAETPRLRWLFLTLAALLLPLCNFLISPEMGLALVVALLAYFIWFALGKERRFACLVLPVLAGAVLVYLVLPKAYFNSILSFGKGGSSFPIFPTVHIMLFLAAAIWVFPWLGLLAIREKSSSAPFCAGLAILMGLFILPATGRCDSGHIIFNSTGLFVIAMSATTWLAPSWRYSFIGLYAVAFPILDVAVFWDHYKQPVEGALEARRQLSQMNFAQDNYPLYPSKNPVPLIHFSKILPEGGWLADLPKSKIGVPLGVDEATEQFLFLTGRMAPEYHIAPYFDLSGPVDLVRKYDDLRSMEYILIPMEYLQYLQPLDVAAQTKAQGEADCRFMSGLMLFPIDLPALHPLFQPNYEIMRHIAGEYEIAKQYPHDLLLKRKSD